MTDENVLLTITGAPFLAPYRGTRRIMTSFSLRQAAQQAGTSKSTILRAIQSGRLSATRTDDGGYSISPAELFRVYPPKSQAVATDQCTEDGTGQNATACATSDPTGRCYRRGGPLLNVDARLT